MQAIVETLFDAAYLSTVVTLGIFMIRRSKGNVQYTLFGWMAVVLGAGDSFHLIPRALALCTTGLESYTFALGLGKWITSVTMTVFYVLLYYVWRRRYQIVGKRGLKEGKVEMKLRRTGEKKEVALDALAEMMGFARRAMRDNVLHGAGTGAFAAIFG